jgi:pimeloyl-ACP methyl ester carboxylesterase
MSFLNCDTPLLRIGYSTGGDKNAVPVLLLHGWPDDATTFDRIAPALQQAGYRTFAPFLRGFGPTRFLCDKTMRSGQIAAFAQDVLDFADALGLDRFAVVGHDWGARAAYVLASVFPERITYCVAMAVGWEPGEPQTPPFETAQAFWYQWFMATERGAAAVHEKGRELARYQWEHWSPPGWFDETTFARVAESFANPDWAEITVHSYRVRWGEADPDPRYAELEQRQKAAETISLPTLMIQGGDDRAVLPSTSEGKGKHFSGPYRRHLLDGVGHFPTREAADEVSKLLLEFLRSDKAGKKPR